MIGREERERLRKSRERDSGRSEGGREIERKREGEGGREGEREREKERERLRKSLACRVSLGPGNRKCLIKALILFLWRRSQHQPTTGRNAECVCGLVCECVRVRLRAVLRVGLHNT